MFVIPNACVETAAKEAEDKYQKTEKSKHGSHVNRCPGSIQDGYCADPNYGAELNVIWI